MEALFSFPHLLFPEVAGACHSSSHLGLDTCLFTSAVSKLIYTYLFTYATGHDQASGNTLFPSIYPQNQSLFYALTYTSDFTGGLSPITVSLREGVNAQLQGNKNSWA